MIGFQSARPTQFGPKKCPYHTMQCPYWIQHFQPDFPLPHIVPSWMAGDPPQMSSGRIGPAPNVWVGECCWRWPCTLKQACNTKLCDMICKMRERERNIKKHTIPMLHTVPCCTYLYILRSQFTSPSCSIQEKECGDQPCCLGIGSHGKPATMRSPNTCWLCWRVQRQGMVSMQLANVLLLFWAIVDCRCLHFIDVTLEKLACKNND